MARKRPHDLEHQPLDAPLLTFDVQDLVDKIKAEETWRRGDRNAMTLMKGKSLRVALVGMQDGAKIKSHRTESAISLQVLEGTIKSNTDSRTVTLKKGSFLTLKAGIPHHVEAQEESVFLLTLAAESPHPAER